MRCLLRPCKPATWGRVGAGPPRRGAALQRLARLVPRSGGGHNPRPLAPCGTAARGICGRRPVGAERRPFSRAGRPPSAGARLVRWPPAPLCCPVSCLLPSRACLPPRTAGPPPSGAGRRSAPGMGALGRPPPLRCAVRGLPPRPARGFFSPPPRGVCGSRRPGSVFLFPVPPGRWGQGAKMQKMVQKWAKNGEKPRKWLQKLHTNDIMEVCKTVPRTP